MSPAACSAGRVGYLADKNTKEMNAGLGEMSRKEGTGVPALENTSSRIGRPAFSEPCQTGCSGIDDLIGGGFFGGELVEIFGAPGSGRTQLLLGSAIRAIVDGHYVIYLDSEGGVLAARVRDLLCKFLVERDCDDGAGSRFLTPFEVQTALEHLLVVRVCSWDELTAAIAQPLDDIVDHCSSVKIIAVDSLAFMFRLCERENAPKRLEMLTGRMAQVAMLRNAVVFIVNNSRRVDILTVSPRVGGDYSAYSRETAYEVGHAAMGDAWAYTCPFRLGLGWSRDRRRVACLVKSSRTPRGRALFRISDRGACDLGEE